MVGDWSDSHNRKLNKIFASRLPVRLVGLREDTYFSKHKRLKYVYKMTSAIIRKKKYPGSNFVVLSSSTNTLQSALNMLKESVMWNHEGSFLIVCRSRKNDAALANSLLRLVWSFNVLSSVVLSYGENNKPTLYTFNPYVDLAPKFWSKVGISENEESSSWTLYYHELDSFWNNSRESFVYLK